jgi:rod shape-determining protein MreC
MPVKGLVQRFALFLLIATAVGLLVAGKADMRFAERLRMMVSDVTAPVLDVLSQPVDAFASLVDHGRELMFLRDENARLRMENERLTNWYAVARTLEQENASFRRLLNFAPDPRPAFIAARVIGDSGGAFVRTVLINAGARHGVRKGQAVVNSEGLVGRVVEAGARSARILLLTDLNSRIPVVLESSRLRAVLAGDNSDRPSLAFLPPDARVSPGDRVVTSGHGTLLPPGIPVGVVAGEVSGIIRVRPLVNWHTLEYVRLLDFTLSGAVPATRAAGAAGPLL